MTWILGFFLLPWVLILLSYPLLFSVGVLGGLVLRLVALAKGSASRWVRTERGVRVGYFHWTGAWRDGWTAVGEDADDQKREFADDLRRALEKEDAKNPQGSGRAERFFNETILGSLQAGMWLGNLVAILLHGLLLMLLVVVSWGIRVLLAAWLRVETRERRMPRECHDCHGWTAAPVWRCPECGREHRQIEPSAKFGVLWWRCTCGARLPTLAVLGRRRLEEICPECGGKLLPLGRDPAGIAFLGGTDGWAARLWRNSLVALAGGAVRDFGWRLEVPPQEKTYVAALSAGHGPEGADRPVGVRGRRGLDLWRCMRLYPVREHFPDTAADWMDQRHWGHVGAVVLAVDASEVGMAEKAFERWLIFMNRVFPGRVRRMSCAVALANADALGAGDAACRSFLLKGGGGNLLNALDGRFGRVRVFAVETDGPEGLGPMWNWTLKSALASPLPRSVRSPTGDRRDVPSGEERFRENASPPTVASRRHVLWSNIVVSSLVWGAILFWGVDRMWNKRHPDGPSLWSASVEWGAGVWNRIWKP